MERLTTSRRPLFFPSVSPSLYPSISPSSSSNRPRHERVLARVAAGDVQQALVGFGDEGCDGSAAGREDRVVGAGVRVPAEAGGVAVVIAEEGLEIGDGQGSVLLADELV